jgi:uncharacterized protein (TIGR02217 family)
MADYDTVRFPPKISLNAVGGPQFKTSVATMASGAEQRIQWWENDRGEWTVSHHARMPVDWQPLIAFFRVIGKGMANTFRFKDWTDYVCANGEGYFTATDGSPSRVQMVKRYTFEGFTYDRIIRKPVSGTVTTDASGLDYASGQALSGTYWYGDFDCKARLGNDAMRCQIINRNPEEGLIVGWDGIEIVEVIDED